MRLPLIGSQGIVWVGTRRGKSAQWIWGLGVRKCRCAGIVRCCRDDTSLMSPVTPAAASRWPRFVFAEPIHSGRCRLPVGCKNRAERVHLERVAELRPGAVRLDITDFPRSDAGTCQCVPDHCLLRRTVRCSESAAGTVLVDGTAADDGQDPVAIGTGIAQLFQHDDAATFPTSETVSRRIECLTAPVRREHARMRQRYKDVRREYQVHAACQRHTAVAGAQRLARQVYRDQ